jgi:hypothetical protein
MQVAGNLPTSAFMGQLAAEQSRRRSEEVPIRPSQPEKSTCASKCFFQLNPPLAEEIHLRWMKSLRDEICLAAGEGGGFHRAKYDFMKDAGLRLDLFAEV